MAETQPLLPRELWDTHHHIFDRVSFPYSPSRHITPPPATIESYEEFKQGLGITKFILVQGLSYGDDTTSLKAFFNGLGEASPSAIGVIDPERISDDELHDLNQHGVKGIRINLYQYRAMQDAELQQQAISTHLQRIVAADLPWTTTMTTVRTGSWDVLEPLIRDKMAPTRRLMINDHFALLKARSMLSQEYRDDPSSQPGFQAVVRLVRDGHIAIKLSAPYRVSILAPHYEDAKFLVRTFVDANNHQVVWGSDWPHTPQMKASHDDGQKEASFLHIDDAAWLQSLKAWLSDEEWDLVMRKNLERVFR
ncbi:hypothetical protein PRZ48_013884 [Zasmidium cellare]|uniref:Amidohydrolase-related domain-containing protein n=1 Tax=Zasmidium cellare TaxID=395010 RepID=A0ABR0DZW6_ZASCE|nr:hypothetical protein PRZ48_013884 [Zasmidium cellare]